jgi:HD-like signal output (HDOD) protein
MAAATPQEVLHDRLKAFLVFLKPRLLQETVDLGRLDQLRRLSDVRVRKFALTRPQITGLDLCGLLADLRTGRFDDLADEAGVLRKGHLAAVLPTLGEDMGYLIEACLTLQAVGPAAMLGHAKAFVLKHGPAAEAATPGAAPASPKSSAPPLPAGVAKLLAPLKDLWSLPPAALKTLSLLAAPDSPPDAVCAEIEHDPAFSTRVLRFANASTPTKSASLKRAVVALGYPLLRRTVMTASLAAKLGPPHAEAGFDERAFWLRSLTAAHAASQVARATRLGSTDEHFSAGMLHHIGRLAAAKAGGPSPEIPDAAVGAAILEKWRFPASIVESARHHADTAEQLEELQLPREAVVVAAICGLIGKTGEPRAWAGFLRVAADSLPAILDQARKSAEAGTLEVCG